VLFLRMWPHPVRTYVLIVRLPVSTRQAIVTGPRLLTFWKKTIRVEYMKFDLPVVQAYLDNQSDGKIPSGKQRDDMIHECKVLVGVERGSPTELAWWEENEAAKLNGGDAVPMPLVASGGRTWGIMMTQGMLGEGISELRASATVQYNTDGTRAQSDGLNEDGSAGTASGRRGTKASRKAAKERAACLAAQFSGQGRCFADRACVGAACFGLADRAWVLRALGWLIVRGCYELGQTVRAA